MSLAELKEKQRRLGEVFGHGKFSAQFAEFSSVDALLEIAIQLATLNEWFEDFGGGEIEPTVACNVFNCDSERKIAGSAGL